MAGLRRPSTVTFVLRQGEDPEEVIDALWLVYGKYSIKGLYCDPFRSSRVMCTLHDVAVAKKIVEMETFKFKGRDVPVTAVDLTLTWVTVSGVPIEMGDEVVTTALSQYGKIIGAVVREKWKAKLSVEKGVRRVQMSMAKPVPNFLRIGSFDLMVSYRGLVRVCRKCGANDHLASACNNRKCLNCDLQGHLAAQCTSKCKKCGGAHSFFQCPEKSYASVTASVSQNPMTTASSVPMVTNDNPEVEEKEPDPPVLQPEVELTTVPKGPETPDPDTNTLSQGPVSTVEAIPSTTTGDVTPVGRKQKKKKRRKVTEGEETAVGKLLDIDSPYEANDSVTTESEHSDGQVVDDTTNVDVDGNAESHPMDQDGTRKRTLHIPAGVTEACALASRVISAVKKVKQ